MVKFRAQTQDGKLEVVGIGLTRENIERLSKSSGSAIIFLQDMGLPYPVEIMLMYGEDDNDLAMKLRPIIGPDTRTLNFRDRKPS